MAKEAKPYSLDAVGIAPDKLSDTNTVEGDDGWKVFTSALNQHSVLRLASAYLKPLRWNVVLMKGSH